MKRILLLILGTMLPVSLSALEPFTFDDPALTRLLEAQKTNSMAYASNEAFLESGKLQYDISKSGLFPQIDADISGGGTNAFYQKYSDVELNNDYFLSVRPEISLSQLLPSSGLLTAQIADTLSASGLEESNFPDIVEPGEIEYSNELSFSVGVSQPLYFGNAYKAALSKINESRSIGLITYRDNRNALIIAAVTDYYHLISAAYRKELVEARLATNSEFEKRMLREHELGMWTKTDLNSAMAARLQSEADLLKAEQAFTAAQEKISALYGIDSAFTSEAQEIRELPFTPDDISLADEQLLSNNPSCLLILKQLIMAESDITMTEKDSAAVLTAGGGYSIRNGITDTTVSSDELSFSLGLSVPAFDGGASKNTVKMKLSESRKLQSDYNNQLKLSMFQLRDLMNNLTVCLKLSDIYQLQKEAAENDYDRGIKELELGGLTRKELLELQIALENIRLSILLNTIDYNLTVLKFYRLLGHDLDLMTSTQEGTDQ